VITGFLGAGKTTLLNRLLRDPALAETVVIVNEFGEVGLDHLLMEGVEDGMILMESGCLCCTLRGDLIVTLEDLLRRRDNGRIAPFRRVVIETTGLADPAPILHTVLMHPYLSRRFALDGVVTVVDAVNLPATLAEQEEAVRQVAVADRIVLAKADIATAEQVREAHELIGALNPGAPILDAAADEAEAANLVGLGLYDLAARPAEVEAWLAIEAVAGGGAGHRHDPNSEGEVQAVALIADQPIRGQTFDLFWTLMTSTHGPKLLRMKGLLCLAEQPERPVVVHAARQVLHPPQELDVWPSDDRSTRIVLIAKGLDMAMAQRLWGAFLGAPTPAPAPV
jgi:G3E family GTPase